MPDSVDIRRSSVETIVLGYRHPASHWKKCCCSGEKSNGMGTTGMVEDSIDIGKGGERKSRFASVLK